MSYTGETHGLSAEKSDSISQIISEFSEIFAFARSRWAGYADEVHPDLKGGGLMMLQVILRKGAVTTTGLSQMLGSDKAIVSRQITKLRELGLVAAEPSAEDRRVVMLTLTPEGSELLAKVRSRWAHTYHERFGEWSIDDLEALRAGLHRFNAGTEVALEGPAARCTRDHAGTEVDADAASDASATAGTVNA